MNPNVRHFKCANLYATYEHSYTPKWRCSKQTISRAVKETYIMVVFGHQWASTILFLLFFQIGYCLEFFMVWWPNKEKPSNHVTCYSEASEHTLSVLLVSIQNHRQQLSVSRKYQASIRIGEKVCREQKRNRMTFLKPLTLPHCQDISNINSIPFIFSSLISS